MIFGRDRGAAVAGESQGFAEIVDKRVAKTPDVASIFLHSSPPLRSPHNGISQNETQVQHGLQDMHDADGLSLLLTDVPDLTGCSSDNGPYYSGARTVRLEFIKNILRYAELDKVYFLAPDGKADALRDGVSLFGATGSSFEVVSYRQLKTSDLGPKVILHSLNANLLRSIEIRQRLQKRTWAVAGLTHDLSDPQVYKDLVLAHASGLRPGDSIFCCSEAARATMIELARQARKLIQQPIIELQLPIVPYAIDAETQLKLPTAPTRERLKIPSDSFVFLFFGRLSNLTKADLRALIKTFAEGLAASKAILLLCGEVSGSLDRDDLENLRALIFELGVQKKVRIVENPSSAMKQLLFSAADAFVCPANSTQESFGLTLLEAMIYELPTIVTNWDGYRDVVIDGETGFLIPTSYADNFSASWEEIFLLGDADRQRAITKAVAIDFEAFLSAMLKIYHNPSFSKTLGAQARARALSSFSWQRVISLHVDHWLRLAKIATKNVHPISTNVPSVDYRASFLSHPGPYR